MVVQFGFQRGQHKMIKKLSFMAVLALPSLAFAQSAAPVRPNHTLPQYGALTAANSNTGAPRAMLRMATPSAGGTYAPLWPPGGLRKDTHIPSLYADGSSGTLDQIGRMADGSVQQTDVGATVAPLDDNKMMPVPVSGDTSSAPVTAKGTTIARNMAARAADANNLSNYVTTYDGSDTFKSQVTALYNALGMNGIIQIPCNAPWPMYDTKTGIAWGPSGKGALFVDTCGNNWRGAPVWTTPAYDRGFGDNNPTLVNYNGEILLNRQNTSSSNGNGLLGVHVSDYSVSAAKYGGGIDADAPMVRFVYDLHQYGLDGVTPVRGSPLALWAVVNNYSGQNWSIQAQALKQTCNNMVAGGSCWAGSFEANDKSGHTSKAWAQQHENNQEGNGPENPESTYNPKKSNRIMEYYSAIALTPAAWAPNTSYNQEDANGPTKVLVADSTGAERILIVKTPGVSGATEPVPDMSKLKEYGLLRDGTVTWEVGTTRENVTGVVVWINRDLPTAGGNASDRNSYNFGVSTEARFNNSVFDTSHALMNSPRAAAYRMGDNQRLSVCDLPTAASDGDLNKCVLIHSSAGKRLNYNINGQVVLFWGDDGSLWAKGNATVMGNLTVGSSLYLGVKSRAAILALPSPAEGQKVFDADDHAEVTYRCPSAGSCGWYPVQYGAALSN